MEVVVEKTYLLVFYILLVCNPFLLTSQIFFLYIWVNLFPTSNLNFLLIISQFHSFFINLISHFFLFSR
jgi:hypothetical protein